MRRYLRHFATLAVVGPLVGFVGCSSSSDDSSAQPDSGTTSHPDASTNKDSGTKGDGGGQVGPGSDGGGQTGPGSDGGGQTGPGTDGGGQTGPGTDGGGTPGTDGGGTPGTDSGTPGTDGGTRTCPVASMNVLADFEDDKLAMVNQGGHDGTWGPFSDSTGAAATLVLGAPPAGNAATCDKFAAHLQATGHGASGQFAGANGNLTKAQASYDLSAYTGIQFDVVAGSGTQTGVYFSIPTTDTLPAASVSGGVPGGTAANAGVNQFNSRGAVLPSIGTTWQTIVVPFATLIPQYFPSPSATSCTAGALCQAPAFNPKNAIEMQFSIGNAGAPNPGTLNLWIDNVQLVTDASAALKPTGMPNNISPTFGNATLMCTKPTGAVGADLQAAYKNWYGRFVSNGGSGGVVRPENGNDVVSEGVAYGMLIAVYMNDPTLFKNLWGYWQQHLAVSTGGVGLMTWITGGQGSATDADQDAAFALLQASMAFATSDATNAANYKTQGIAMVKAIWANEIDTAQLLPTGGSNYKTTTGGGSNSSTNPSYFAPEYYNAFAKADPGDNWAGVRMNVYKALNALSTNLGGTGLLPAWCSNGCTAIGSNGGGANDGYFQYDAHRIPWRFGLDLCWHGAGGNSTSGLTKLVNYLTGLAATASSGGGTGRIVDMYQLSGTAASGSAPNSMSLIGSLGVGAMAVGGANNATFANSAWQFVLDGGNRATLDVATSGTQSAYSYYNATVGLITALSMSGNMIDKF